MTFFTDKWVIGRIDQQDLVLVRKFKRNIFLEWISQYEKDNREVLTTEVLEEYDVALGPQDNIYILYQNIEGHLILNVINDKEKKEICLTQKGLSEVFNLGLEVQDKFIHILYTIKANDNKYLIYHHFYDGNIWKDFIVDEIKIKKVINPMKSIVEDEKLILVYYTDDYSIVLKDFNTKELQWSDSTQLVEGENEKLFLDALIVDGSIHLSFCQYIDGNLIASYIRFDQRDGIYEKTMEKFISNEGGPSHPSIIYYKNELWIVWLELDKLFSRSSKDNGLSWGPIYMWNETKKIDFIRYKYASTIKDEKIHFDYSFGSIYPKIKFLGFGPTNKAVEIPIKKKTQMKFYSP
ncbi:MAG: hypothetical protein GX021_02900 [Tissierellia bacterium]|nr:hypothetical protein [Tissierellia bacterium]